MGKKFICFVLTFVSIFLIVCRVNAAESIRYTTDNPDVLISEVVVEDNSIHVFIRTELLNKSSKYKDEYDVFYQKIGDQLFNIFAAEKDMKVLDERLKSLGVKDIREVVNKEIADEPIYSLDVIQNHLQGVFPSVDLLGRVYFDIKNPVIEVKDDVHVVKVFGTTLLEYKKSDTELVMGDVHYSKD